MKFSSGTAKVSRRDCRLQYVQLVEQAPCEEGDSPSIGAEALGVRSLSTVGDGTFANLDELDLLLSRKWKSKDNVAA